MSEWIVAFKNLNAMDWAEMSCWFIFYVSVIYLGMTVGQ